MALSDGDGVTTTAAEEEKKKGDKCFKREDFDGAVHHYQRALRMDAASVDTSSIIRNFLQAAQIRNLAIFLKELDDNNLATRESTALLLCCLSDLKLVSSGKVYDFVQKSVVSKDSLSAVLEECLDTTDLDDANESQLRSAQSETALKTLLAHASGSSPAHVDEVVGEHALAPASPTIALRSLAQTSGGNFGSVKDYVARALVDETRHLRSTHKQVRGLKRDVQKSRTQLQELQRTSHIFQSNRCCRCAQALDLPAVYFFCAHNYHEACSEGFCTKC